MLILVTMGLVAVAAVALAVGFVSNHLGPIYVSIICSALAGMVLVLFARLTRRQTPVAAGAGPAPLRNDMTTAFQGRVSAPGRLRVTNRVAAEPELPVWDDEDEVEEETYGGWAEAPLFPIEDYDELRVSDILPLLVELDPDELEEVRQRESEGKARATILTRIRQLAGDLEAVSGPVTAPVPAKPATAAAKGRSAGKKKPATKPASDASAKAAAAGTAAGSRTARKSAAAAKPTSATEAPAGAAKPSGAGKAARAAKAAPTQAAAAEATPKAKAAPVPKPAPASKPAPKPEPVEATPLIDLTAPATPAPRKRAAAPKPAKETAVAKAAGAASTASRRKVDPPFPIQNYDGLRASAIVGMLAELDDAELELVARRELAGEGRATIVSRIEKLLGRSVRQGSPAQ